MSLSRFLPVKQMVVISAEGRISGDNVNNPSLHVMAAEAEAPGPWLTGGEPIESNL